jgi:hypothetical protein
LAPWRWETHAIPELGGTAQDIIDRQAVETCDVVMAVFNARLGTATDDAVSGTAHEIIHGHRAGKPVHVYFSTQPFPRDTKPEKLQRLNNFHWPRGISGGRWSPTSPRGRFAAWCFYVLASSRAPCALGTWRTSASRSIAQTSRRWSANSVGSCPPASGERDGTARCFGFEVCRRPSAVRPNRILDELPTKVIGRLTRESDCGAV